MQDKAHRPLAALAGVGFCLLGILGTLVYPSGPDVFGEPAAIASLYKDNENGVLAADAIYLLSGTLLLVFAGYLRSVVARVEAPDGIVASVAFGGLVAGAAVGVASASLDLVGALRVGEQGTIAPETAAALSDSSAVLYGTAFPVAAGVGVLAVAVASLRAGALPKWLGALSAILGVAMLLPPISYIAIIVFGFWALATGVVLFIRPAGDRRGVSAAEATASA